MRPSPLLAIFLIVAVDILGYTIILPLLPFFAERLGASPGMVGALLAVYAVCQLIAGPILGKLSDQFGRKPLLIVSQIGTLAGFLVLAFANQLWLVFLSRIVDGATAGNLSLAQAYISDVTAPKDRARSFGIIGIAFGLGFLVGPAMSGFLSQWGFQYPIFAAVGLSATSILATTVLLPGNTNRTEGAAATGRRLSLLQWGEYADYFRRPHMSPLLWKFFSYVLSFSIFMGGFALFAERRYLWNGRPFGPKEVGYLLAYSGLVGGTLQGGMLGRLVKRFGERALLVSSLFACVVGYIIVGFAFTIPVLLVASTVAAFGGVARPVVTSLITQAAERSEQGSVLGLTQSLMSVAQITGPLIAGGLIEANQLTLWALAAAVAALAGALVPMPPATVAESSGA